MDISGATLASLSLFMGNVVVLSHVRRDWRVTTLIIMTVLSPIFYVVRGGEQIATAYAVSALVWALLHFSIKDTLEKNPLDPVSPWERVDIIDGYTIMNANKNVRFDTYDPTSPSYRRLVPSMNRMGGQQFTYSCWLNFGSAITDDIAGKTLFMRGDPRNYTPRVKDPNTGVISNFHQNQSGSDITIMCPRVYFGSSNSLRVQINTDTDFIFETEIGSSYGNKELRQNLLSIVPRHWFLLTIVFEDNIPINDFETGTSIKAYYNEVLYDTATTTGSMRMNNGPLHVMMADTDWPQNSRIADLRYYNYALSQSQVQRNYNMGPSTNVAAEMPRLVNANENNDFLRIGPYNRVDKTNYDASLQMLKT